MFVAADRFAGDPIDVGEPVEPAADQHGVHGADHRRRRACGLSMRARGSVAHPLGIVWYRWAHRLAVGQDTPYLSAARAIGHP